MMGIPETIAETIDDYISIAARLANDRQARSALSRRIADNKHKVYCDRACVPALEDFLECAARQPAA
jgi:predicted O-linked N-acetylglucosamine transferase (SPINDLY family)